MRVAIRRYAAGLRRAARAVHLATAAFTSIPILIAFLAHARAGDEGVIATETGGVILIGIGMMAMVLALGPWPDSDDDGRA